MSFNVYLLSRQAHFLPKGTDFYEMKNRPVIINVLQVYSFSLYIYGTMFFRMFLIAKLGLESRSPNSWTSTFSVYHLLLVTLFGAPPSIAEIFFFSQASHKKVYIFGNLPFIQHHRMLGQEVSLVYTISSFPLFCRYQSPKCLSNVAKLVIS